LVILDTNVISELTHLEANPKIVAWVDKFDHEELYTTAVTKAEILYGLAAMPAGRRKFEIEETYRNLFKMWFLGRILPFDNDCSIHFAWLAAAAMNRGGTYCTADLQISAIATLHGLDIATRDTRGFEHEDLRLIDPWEES
jgi:toxin FitB